MRKVSQKQLTDHVQLVKWEEKKTLEKFNLLTVHSLLLNSNPKFIQLKQKIQIFNSNVDKGVDRKHLQFEFTKKLYEMLRQMVQVPNFQTQQEFLNNVYEWSKQGGRTDFEFDEFSQHSKSRPTTATTKARPFSAYSRPRSGVSKMNFIRLEEQLEIKPQKKNKDNIDYEKLKPGDIEFYTGARTLHQNEEKPKKKLKEYQRKIFYEQEPDSDIQIIDLKEEKKMPEFKSIVPIVQPQEQPVEAGQNLEGQNKPEGQDMPLGQQDNAPEGDEQINIDDLPIQGQNLEQEPQEVVDKLKPRLKAFVKHETDLSKNKLNYVKGVHEYIEERNKMIRRNQEDDIIKSKMLEWAKEKSRTKRQQKRRAESARIVTNKIGIGYKKEEPQVQNCNVINFQNVPVLETKQARPKTAFRAFNQANRKQLIQNCFMTSKMDSHIRKFDNIPTGQTLERGMRITSLAEKPKKKTFEQILREAEQKVRQEQVEQIMNVKEKFAKNKLPFETNRIAKSVTYHGLGALDDQYDDQAFAGDITGVGMIKNPFFKFGKKKKKKKKKK